MADANMTAARSRGDALLIPKRRRRSRPVNLDRIRRERIEALVEHLIALLDVWDGDPEEGIAHFGPEAGPGDPEDAEDTHDREWDLADREPQDDELPPRTAMRPSKPEVFRILPDGTRQRVTGRIVGEWLPWNTAKWGA